ncbi:4-oxalomesaconate tautomerase [Glycomyces sp. NPDC047369]
MNGVPCTWMRAGTSKGAFFFGGDLPADPAERDDLLLRVMGSPDPRQIDGIGGATGLTSKVAVVSPSAEPGIDIDYLFLQLGTDAATVSDRQTCGNILAGVGQFALERGLASASGAEAEVRIRLVNTGAVATAAFPLTGGRPEYRGDTAVDGVPGTAAPVRLLFEGTAGSATGALLPTGSVRDRIAGIEVTCVDNGMPVVLAEADAFGLNGSETPADLEADTALLDRVDALRIEAARPMGLGDVTASSVPKTVLVAPARAGGHVRTLSFIPRRPHAAIGVFAAVSAVTALTMDGAVGADLATTWPAGPVRVDVEHPSGHLLVDLDRDATGVKRAGVVRTARKLFEGRVYPRD